MQSQEEEKSKLIKIDEITYDRESTIYINILSIVVFLIGLAFMSIITGQSEISLNGIIVGGLVVLFTIIIIGNVIFHEFLHGIGFKLFGSKPKYGFMFLYKFFPVGYTHARGNFTKQQMNIILLLPFAIITSLGIIISIISILNNNLALFYLVYIFALVNLSGCTGDFYVVYQLFKFPSSVLIENRDVTDPLYIWNTKEISFVEKDQSKVTSFFKDSLVFTFYFLLLLPFFGIFVTSMLFFLAPVLPIFRIETFHILAWEIISNSSQLSVHVANSIDIFALSVIGAILLTMRKPILRSHKGNAKEEMKEEKQVNVHFIA